MTPNQIGIYIKQSEGGSLPKQDWGKSRQYLFEVQSRLFWMRSNWRWGGVKVSSKPCSLVIGQNVRVSVIYSICLHASWMCSRAHIGRYIVWQTGWLRWKKQLGRGTRRRIKNIEDSIVGENVIDLWSTAFFSRGEVGHMRTKVVGLGPVRNPCYAPKGGDGKNRYKW